MGGILFFRNGLRMLDAKIGRSRTTPAEQEESQDNNDIARAKSALETLIFENTTNQ